MRFAMTAKTLVRERRREKGSDEEGVREITAKNVQKVTRFRKNGLWDLEREVRRLESLEKGTNEGR